MPKYVFGYCFMCGNELSGFSIGVVTDNGWGFVCNPKCDPNDVTFLFLFIPEKLRVKLYARHARKRAERAMKELERLNINVIDAYDATRYRRRNGKALDLRH